jgi:hypothetical protein
MGKFLKRVTAAPTNSGKKPPKERSPAATAATNRVTIALHSCAAAKRRITEAWRLQVVCD